MSKLTFILGGARSGKSTLAEQLAARCSAQTGGSVLYIATAQAGDEEMRARIQAHRRSRPSGWQTLEAPLSVAAALQDLQSSYDIVLLDCLTLLVSNLLMAHSDEQSESIHAGLQTAVEAEIDALLETIQHSQADWFVVSNEVGLGLVPPYPFGRAYRDLLGRVNQRFAACADAAYLMVAGLTLPLHHLKIDPLAD